MKKLYSLVVTMFYISLIIPTIFISQVSAQDIDTVTIGDGSFSNYRYPVNRSAAYSASQMLYTGADIERTGLISQISFEQTSGNGGNIYPCAIYMKVTTDTSVSQSATVLSTYTKVWEGAWSASGNTEWKKLALQLPFAYTDSTKNLSIIMTTGYQEATTNYPQFSYTTGNIDKCAYYYSDSTPWTDDEAMTVVNNRPNINLMMSELTPCTSAPPASSVFSTAEYVCPGSPVSFFVGNVPLDTGYTFKWESSTDNANWSEVANITVPFLTAIPDSGTTLFYRSIVSCGLDSSYSNFGQATSSFIACYCQSIMNCTASDVISEVALGSNQPYYTGNACDPNNNGYSLNTISNPVIYVSDTESIVISTDGDTEGVAAWIDFNHDGKFNSNELIISNYSSNVPYTHTANFAIPANTMTGSTMMRVIAMYGTVPTNPCADAGDFGEAEDYLITISSIPLYIKFDEIAASNFGTRNKISWSTLREDAGDAFHIERSEDGRNFKELATVSSTGMANNYEYWDENPYADVTYYRIRTSESASTKSFYSKTVQAKLNSNADFDLSAYPNPTTGEAVNISVSGALEADQTLTLIDAMGRVVYTTNMEGVSYSLDMNNLAKGLYILQYKSANHQQSVRLVKQ